MITEEISASSSSTRKHQPRRRDGVNNPKLVWVSKFTCRFEDFSQIQGLSEPVAGRGPQFSRLIVAFKIAADRMAWAFSEFRDLARGGASHHQQVESRPLNSCRGRFLHRSSECPIRDS